ncbi:dirigent protein 24-like [Neltuma alba]|uniref:dirigent protein 24-like n=1 Tax=Neltuma alba TaxID=207710 RepID=UPI0010A54C81|nr:dirigent protein 24-like [Prosopis alba]
MRRLHEVDPAVPQIPATTLPSTQIPAATAVPPLPVPVTDDTPEETPTAGAPVAAAAAAAPTTVDADDGAADDDENVDDSTQAPAAVTASAPAAGDESEEENPDQPEPAAVTPALPVAGAPVAGGNAAAAANPAGKEPTLSFYMHDVIGGTHPSARVVAGIVANTDVTGLPFSKINNNLFPIVGGIPLVNPKLNGIVTNNNLPLLVGLNAAQTSTVFQNRGSGSAVSGGDNRPFVNANNLPSGFTLQKLMFGSVTVIDDQLTEGHELDSTVIGKAEGLYLASSLDGTSQTLVVTVILHSGEEHHGVEDTISFFGVHRTASPGSEIAVIGGTGKYENAMGYAALESLPKVDQHTTDGVDTILHFNVYLTDE